MRENSNPRHLVLPVLFGLHYLLAMGTLVWKGFTMDVGQMQWWRHDMILCSR